MKIWTLIWRITSFLRIFLLLFICILLINNSYIIEGGLIGLYILIEALISRIKELEKRLNNLEELKNGNNIR